MYAKGPDIGMMHMLENRSLEQWRRGAKAAEPINFSCIRAN